MTDGKHTPGPWKVFRTHNGEQIIGIGRADTGDGVTDPRFGLWCSGEERDANAALIAQAPTLLAERDRLKAINAELLAALKHAFSDLDHGYGCTCTYPEPDCCGYSHARAAISRATVTP